MLERLLMALTHKMDGDCFECVFDYWSEGVNYFTFVMLLLLLSIIASLYIKKKGLKWLSVLSGSAVLVFIFWCTENYRGLFPMEP